jgi:large subunit ribosomal protein L25
METVELEAELRSTAGKGPARQLRRSGKAPAVFYGPKRQTTQIAIDSAEFLHKIAALEGSHLIRFRSSAADVSNKVALVKEAQYHPVSGALLHADFYEVDMTAKLRVPVPLHFTGKAVGVANGGILQPVRREVEVECLPSDIPDFIGVDVSALGIHDALHVSQLEVPAGVSVPYDTDFTLVTVLPPTVEEVKVAEAAPVEAAVEGAAAPAEPGKAEPEKKGGPA